MNQLGALDSSTSVQIMDLLKEIAKDRLVIMVTHNPELADKYSTRIIKLLDGNVISDSNPYEGKEEHREEGKNKKTSMSFFTALSLSLNNLMTKKGRTFLTAFAGSIGIIGIATIMSLSNGVQKYISKVEEDTLSSYPITLEETTVDMGEMIQSVTGNGISEDNSKVEDGKIESSPLINDLIKMLSAQTSSNNLKEFKKFIEENGLDINNYANAVQYKYNLDLNIYNNNANSDSYVKTSPNQILTNLGMEQMQEMQTKMYGNTFGSYEIWEEMLDNEDLLASQYDLLAGKWPKEFNEVVLIVDEDTKISDYTLYSLGLLDPNELTEKYKALMKGEKVDEIEKKTYTYDELLDLKFKLVLNTDYYVNTGNLWKDMSEDEEYMKSLLEEALELKVTGIIRKNEESVVMTTTGGVGYKPSLKEYVINKINESEIAKEQKENEKVNVFTGLEFTDEQKAFDYNNLSNEEKAYIAKLSQAELAELMKTYADNNGATYETNLVKLGVVDEDKPSGINLYPKDFASKEKIADIIEEYNQKQRDEGKEENAITYSDLVGTMMNSVTAIIDVISYVLIAFVSVSLVVSSIMIGIITYISVLERIKEIGILRSIGASKKDISRVFNAETLIVGLTSGLIGIGITLLICIPVNTLIKVIAGVSGIASLPLNGGIILICISVILTVIAGLIPSKLAAKKDPVEALRTE